LSDYVGVESRLNSAKLAKFCSSWTPTQVYFQNITAVSVKGFDETWPSSIAGHANSPSYVMKNIYEILVE